LLKPEELGTLIRVIKEAQNFGKISAVTALVLNFTALVFCRPGEIIAAKWGDVDFTEKIWRQPLQKNNAEKGRAVAPLARQTLELLTTLKAITGHTDYLFPVPDSTPYR